MLAFHSHLTLKPIHIKGSMGRLHHAQCVVNRLFVLL